ncbi:DUF3888 domain-containing protein [Clostridium sporogenes]|uniref:DUF3888 domain-containing protein n=1 Tax=Clostridium TaxID=1485 RepID=UPI0009B7EE87|nr:DUF3888 domain-containing protein [Clostridium botulinum]NFF66296.1 DUF3888 domain-containing protein [Clostridium sporogenes]NFF97281.1 DUF3888 domain-containing protein [Clostridium sporogenes]NFG04817.1 DUF3888 domain-containing protein [Clostridium sporogenes]NFG51854.1 DUF3888 domain-containing protein [Clostridium sporogenes]
MIITIIFFLIALTKIYCCTFYPNDSLINACNINKDQSYTKLENDLLIRVFSPYIAKSIENYYGEPRQFDLWDAKIINIKQLGSESFNFEIIISVTTFKGAHNPPYGLETVTIKLDDSGTHIINFNHQDI